MTQAQWGQKSSIGMNMLEVMGHHPYRQAAQQGMDRALAAHKETEREKERKELAYKIHEDLAQALVAPGMTLTFLAMLDEHIQQVPEFQTINDIAERSIASIRNMVSELRSMAINLGLLLVNTNVFKLFTWMANFDEARISKETSSINTHIDSPVKKFQALGQGVAEEEENKTLQALETGLRKYQKTIGSAIDMATNDLTTGAGMAQAATMERSRADSARTITPSMALVAAAVLGSLGLAWWISRRVMAQLGGEPAYALQVLTLNAAIEAAQGAWVHSASVVRF